jgi:hypothetical protein
MTQINGPVNIIRVEGYIYNIKKVMYLFMDHHYDLSEQSSCDNDKAKDIVLYLNDELKTSSVPIDFFMETSFKVKDFILKKETNKSIYIDRVKKFFFDNVIIKDKKNIGTKLNKNIRFHYIDIRHYLQLNFMNTLTKLKENMDNENEKIKLINILNDKINTLIQFIDNPSPDIINDDELINIISKIKSRYTHPELKQKIKDLFNISKYGLIKIYNENKIITANEDINILSYKIIRNISWIMDIYFLRRFIDKDYIHNVISYIGGAHTVRILIFLLKNYNMEITHCVYSTQSIDYINKYIKSKSVDIEKNLDDVFSMFFSRDLKQCSDISDFPEHLFNN